jgi:mRNA-degrading endonuclease RelE of RelBE toxin-antitoxin system
VYRCERTRPSTLSAAMRRRAKGSKLEKLKVNPFDPQHSKPLKGRKEQRSARVGDLRIVFWVEESTVIVAAISPRGQVYKQA